MLFVLAGREQLIQCLPKGGRVAEVGVFAGEFAKIIKQEVHPAELHLIDPWRWVEGVWENDQKPYSPSKMEDYYRFVKQAVPDYDGGHPDRAYETLYQRVGEFASQNECIYLHRGTSSEKMSKFPDKFFDFIYIDAMHTYEHVMEDLMLSDRKIKDGGIISGHDFFENRMDTQSQYGVIDAVNSFCKRMNYQVLALTCEAEASFFLYRGMSPYSREFLLNILSSDIFCIELPGHLASTYCHKVTGGRRGSLPSFGGTLIS